MSIKKLSRRQWLNRSAAAGLGLTAGMRINAVSAAEPENLKRFTAEAHRRQNRYTLCELSY